MEIVSQHHDKEALILTPQGQENNTVTDSNKEENVGYAAKLPVHVTTSMENVVSWVILKSAAIPSRARGVHQAAVRVEVVEIPVEN